jgi:hypothetical protein
MPSNGVEVRGLRVLRTHEDAACDGGGTSCFERDRKAEAARRRFVDRVAAMSDDEYAAAEDRQVVLDGT